MGTSAAVDEAAGASSTTDAGSDAGSSAGSSDDAPSAGVLSGLDAKDSHGLSVSSYQLSTDGGGMTSPIKLITNGFLLNMLWEGYRWLVGLAATMINMALQMSWVDALANAVQPVATTLQVNIIDRLGLSRVALSLSGLAAGWFIARGKYVTGVGKLVSAGVFAGLAATLLANPVASITGPDGLLAGARDLGQATSTIVVSNGQSADPDPAQIQSQTSASLVDVFVRLPHQLLNYGAVIDGTGCQDAYDKALKEGPRASDDDGARKAVGDCDEKLKKYADDPGWTGVWSALILLPAGLLLVVMAIVLAVVLFLATAVALFCALKLIWDVVMAQAPGERSGFAGSLASLVGAVVSVIFFMILLGIYCVLLGKMMGAKDGQDPVVRFLIVDLLMVVLIVVTIIARKRIAERGREWAQRASSWAGVKNAKPVQMPRMSQLTQAGSTLAAGRMQARRLGPSMPTTGNAAQRLGQRVAQSKLVKTGVAAATLATGAGGLALKSTIGAPVYAPRAARAASAAVKARSAAMRSRLQTARSGAGSFAKEYAHNVGVVAGPIARPVAKAGTAAGKAAGRKAAPTVTAAGIHFGAGRAPGGPTSPTSTRKAPVSAPRRAASAGQPTPANVAANAARLAARRRDRLENPASSSSDLQAGIATQSFRVAKAAAAAAPAKPRPTAADEADVSRLYERMRVRTARRDNGRS
ncbi:hypothetical protein [Kineococcus rhizosphaerae]|nr:hypothetical protein [Kineococcus rhizosphaerae]